MIALLAQSSTTQPSGNPFGALILFAPLILVFYFLLIRPQRRRTQEQQALLADLEVGDEVMTSGGIFGTVTEIDDDEGTVSVEIAPGTTIRMVKAGIARRLVEDEYDEEDDEDEDDNEEGADATT